MKRQPSVQEMERAVYAKDASFDGVFVACVRTTGIFCRPTCPARKPLAKNMEYFTTAREALLAGYRPCKRCRPMDANGRPPEWVEQLFAHVESAPAERLVDADLRALGIDPTRARRFFRKHYGMTFQAYHRMRRMGMALTQVRKGADLSRVALDHGFDSSSGFRDAFVRVFGQPPGAARTSHCVVTQRLETPLGAMVAAASDDGVCLLEFADRRALESEVADIRKRLDCAIVPGSNGHVDTLADELSAYFEGRLTRFSVPLVTPGTPFQRQAWKALEEIPYGETISYGEQARRMGKPGAQRAVGRANGGNRIAIVIPCHRVVQQNGQLRGYGGGLWRKQHLLDLEREVIGRATKRVAL